MQEKSEIKNPEIPTRLELIIEYFGRNKTWFAEQIGYHRQKIYDMTTGKVKLDVDFLRSLCTAPLTKHVNIRWLITGEGSMLLEKPMALKAKALALIEKLIEKEDTSAP